MQLHGIEGKPICLEPDSSKLPLQTGGIDYVHCSDVLQHTPNPEAILGEFHRIMKPGAEGRITVYNRDCLSFHLYVAYQKMLIEGAYAGCTLDEAFAGSTDGEECPISCCYRPGEFVDLLEGGGVRGAFRRRSGRGP